ncbi:hypothetical protein KUG12_25955 [Streptomyces sp. BV333]|uniref:hypothetical protein n=1 Tax=Streptomyces sp. BV333 TaxID=2849673 RepID=UPI001C2EF567|nr:hypothetical protein [Streptomyces sp. BV333]MBV1957735.1 hypothetical protein [Streptomyces sp. BV333]
MTRHYAIEITLTRPVSLGELCRARKHVALAENADRTQLMSEAQAHGQRPREFLGRRLAEAVERSQQERRRRLTAHLESLLHQHTREEVLSCAASLLSHRHPPAAP